MPQLLTNTESDMRLRRCAVFSFDRIKDKLKISQNECAKNVSQCLYSKYLVIVKTVTTYTINKLYATFCMFHEPIINDIMYYYLRMNE